MNSDMERKVVMSDSAATSPVLRYDSRTVVLHWVSALLILTLMLTGLVMEHLGALEEATRSGFVQFHVLLGAATLIVNLVRLSWRFGHKPPPPAAFRTEKEAFIGEIVHGLMYFLMILVPIAGWALVSAGYPVDGQASLYALPAWPLPDVGKGAAAASVFTALHDYGAWILLALIAVHMSAAIAHHLSTPADGLMRRIWFK